MRFFIFKYYVLPKDIMTFLTFFMLSFMLAIRASYWPKMVLLILSATLIPYYVPTSSPAPS